MKLAKQHTGAAQHLSDTKDQCRVQHACQHDAGAAQAVCKLDIAVECQTIADYRWQSAQHEHLAMLGLQHAMW